MTKPSAPKNTVLQLTIMSKMFDGSKTLAELGITQNILNILLDGGFVVKGTDVIKNGGRGRPKNTYVLTELGKERTEAFKASGAKKPSRP